MSEIDTVNATASGFVQVAVTITRGHSRREFLKRAAALAAITPTLQRPAPFETNIPALLRQFSVPGLAFALVENGVVTRAEGFGVKKIGAADAVTADTIFEAASLSKPVFAYLTLKLAELGRVDLDASIGSFFRQPDFVNDNTVDLITPRIVLSHQTGLPNWRPAQQPMTFRFKPGAGFGYSGESYVRLQRFVEKTTAQPLTSLAGEREFAPWNMDRSSYLWRAGFERLAAEGHDATGTVVRTRLWAYDPATSGMRMPPGVEPPPIFAVPNAAASLYTSARDYGRFLERLLAPPPADTVHLGRKWLDTMFTPASRVNESLTWGLGWGLARANGTDTFWHWGNNNVYQGFVAGSRAKRWGLVVLTNSANGLRLCRELFARAIGTEHPAFRWNLVIPQ